MSITANRWWIYQRERFPLAAHVPLIAAFSFSAVSYSALLRGDEGGPALWSVGLAFVTSIVFFLMLRIADEFKDFEDDSRHRPYRPVPRGLIKLRELGWLGVGAAVVQLLAVLVFLPSLFALLAITWIYLAGMSHEFFLRDWLKARPITYMWTHMLIMPLIDLTATASDWLSVQSAPPSGLVWFLLVSFCNGIVIEIGRKLRAPMDEEVGVETYTVLWGRKRAPLIWLAALGVTAFFALQAAHAIDYFMPIAAVLTLLLVLASWRAWVFMRSPITANAKWFERLAGIWTLAMYLSLGALPLLWKL